MTLHLHSSRVGLPPIMTEITYASIQPLVASQEVEGGAVNVLFRCEETGVEKSAQGRMKRSDSLKSTAARSAKRSLFTSLRRSVVGAIGDALGNSAAGRVARDVANQGLRQTEQKTAFSKEELQLAVVEAFGTAQGSFRFDEGAGAWRGVQEPKTAFEKRLAEKPITERYDQGVLARALVELSAADGEVSEEEVGFVQGFLDPEMGTVEELAQRDKLTGAELSEVSESARGSILMVAWACALCDEELDAAEEERLGELATGFGLEEDAAKAAKADAQRYLVDKALAGVYTSGKRDDAAFTSAREAADSMGVDGEDFERWDAAYRKAGGIV